MKKIISIITIAALFAVSCDKATVGAPAEVEVITPGLVKYTLTVNKSEDTKVIADAQGALTWEGGEVLTISCEAWEQTYQSEPVAASAAGAKVAEVVFTAPEHEGAEVYVSLGSVAASVEGSQSPVLTGVASVEGAAEGQTGSVTLSPAAAHFRFTDIPSGVQSIKIAAVGGESVANEEAKLITVTGISGTECGVNILPEETYTKGLVLAFEGTNGAIIKSLSYNKELTLGASSLRNISLAGAAPVQLVGTVEAKTTYSQALAGEKGTSGDGANNTANTNRVWDINHELTSVDNLSEALKSFVSFVSYECDDQVLTSGNEFSSISLGEKNLKANFKFECGALSIPVASLSTKVQITGLPYSYVFSSSSKRYNETETKNEGWILNSNTGTQTNQLFVASGSNVGSLNKKFAAPKEISLSATVKCKYYTASFSSNTKNLYVSCTNADNKTSTSNLLGSVKSSNDTNGYNDERTVVGNTKINEENPYITITCDQLSGGVARYMYIHSIELLYK